MLLGLVIELNMYNRAKVGCIKVATDNKNVYSFSDLISILIIPNPASNPAVPSAKRRKECALPPSSFLDS